MIQHIRIKHGSQLVVEFTTSLVFANDILKEALKKMDPSWKDRVYGTWALEHYNTDDRYPIGWERYVQTDRTRRELASRRFSGWQSNA